MFPPSLLLPYFYLFIYCNIFYLNGRFIKIYGRASEWEKEQGSGLVREVPSICCFPPHMAVCNGWNGTVGHQEPRASSFLTRLQGHSIGAIFHWSPRHKRGEESEVQHLGFGCPTHVGCQHSRRGLPTMSRPHLPSHNTLHCFLYNDIFPFHFTITG